MLELEDVHASYAGRRVLHGVSLAAARGEIVSLIGPSGSGKSTVLRAAIGLTPLDAGTVRLDGAAVDYASAESLKRLRRRMSIVFQQYNLFQNMDVLANICLAPVKVLGLAPAEAEGRAMALLGQMGLADKARARPSQLSGGQQQRVAIVRALAMQPDILLLDEVTAALDPERVGEVLDTVQALASTGITLLIVSHEMAFVRRISHRVVMMDEGRVVETGPAEAVFGAPQQARTQAFMRAILRD